MVEQAKITSIDVLERFRASLIVFLTKARRAVDQVGDDCKRTGFWVQSDQRTFWETQLRKRMKVYDRVQQELLTAKLSSFRDNLMAEQAAVRKAKREVEEAELKLRNVKHWTREFDRTAEPMLRRLEMIRQFLDHELPQAVAYLAQAQKTLDGYSDRASSIAVAALPPDLPLSPDSPNEIEPDSPP